MKYKSINSSCIKYYGASQTATLSHKPIQEVIFDKFKHRNNLRKCCMRCVFNQSRADSNRIRGSYLNKNNIRRLNTRKTLIWRERKYRNRSSGWTSACKGSADSLPSTSVAFKLAHENVALLLGQCFDTYNTLAVELTRHI